MTTTERNAAVTEIELRPGDAITIAAPAPLEYAYRARLVAPRTLDALARVELLQPTPAYYYRPGETRPYRAVTLPAGAHVDLYDRAPHADTLYRSHALTVLAPPLHLVP